MGVEKILTFVVQIALKALNNIRFMSTPPFFLIGHKPYPPGVPISKLFEVYQMLLPGDIVVRKYKGFLNLALIPGFYDHVGLYTGYNTVIDASGTKGVAVNNVFDFLLCDALCIVRVKDVHAHTVTAALDTAFDLVDQKIEYDWDYSYTNDSLHCTELVEACYNGIFDDSREIVFPSISMLKRNILTPDGLANSNAVQKIWEYRK